MADVSYYETLSVEKTATEDEIKRAYRKLAIRYHPDKNLEKKEEAEIKFKEIGEAYAVLSDAEKRRQYDRFGKGAVNGSGGGGGGGPGMHGFQGQDAEEIFRTFFGGQDPFSMFFQEGIRGGAGGAGMRNFGGGQRVHMSQFGPGFTFTSFGNAGGMPGMRMHRVNQRQGGPGANGAAERPQANGRLSRFRVGGGNMLLIFFLLWIMGVPFSYLWIALMLCSYLGLV